MPCRRARSSAPNRRDALGGIVATTVAAMGCGGLAANARAAGGQERVALTGFVDDDPRFGAHAHGPKHPEQPARFAAIQRALEVQRNAQPASDWVSRLLRLRPASTAIVDEALRRVHTSEHIASIDARYDTDTRSLARAAVGAALSAVDSVMQRRIVNAFVATRPPGHHARNTGREEGFCYFNNVAVAARHLQRAHGIERVLIVDWDYHHGDGTEHLFYEDPSVFYFSTFDPNAYPRTGDPARRGAGAGVGFTSNHPLRCGASDAEMLAVYRDHLEPIADRFKPQFVLVSCGFDSRKEDLLGCFDISDEGYRRMTRVVAGIAARHAQGRLVSLLEGGYNLAGLASAAMTHTETLVEQARLLPPTAGARR
jgi:acetoin utilization deacetylase AcuC-like enzyme